MRTLGLQGDKPHFITRVFSDLTLEETEIKILQAISKIAIPANDNLASNRLALFSPDGNAIREFVAATDESKRDALLCQIVNNPKTSDGKAQQVYNLLSDDSTVRISGIMKLVLMGPAFMFFPLAASMAAKYDLYEKCGSFLGMWIGMGALVIQTMAFVAGVRLALTAPESYKDAVFGKYLICRKKWRLSHAILAGSAISLYAFFRSKQDSIPLNSCFEENSYKRPKDLLFFPTIVKIARFSCDIIAVSSAIAETRKFFGI